MNRSDLKSGRKSKGWSQQEAARKLKVSQAYLSLLENGSRPVPKELALKAANVFGMSAVTLPVNTRWENVQAGDSSTVAADLACLGYPDFAYLTTKRAKNPAEALLSALSAPRLESRVAEALPWLLFRYPDLDWNALIAAAKSKDLQNRLGFVTCIARKVAEKLGEKEKAELLANQEKILERSRLLLEDTLCNDSLTVAERNWLNENRPEEAKYWRVLSDLSPEHLSYAT
ncbi:MAG TPA: helix-turn-helix transcriptional regulator [Pyrinomonadaceae bacterium]|nr:helix-turn-helix transcriptional regulator [Pyrinomonadaceae bacterium]